MQESKQNCSRTQDFLDWSQIITRGFEFYTSQSFDSHDQLTFIKYLVERKSKFRCRMLFLLLAQKQVQIWGLQFSLIVGFRSPNFAQRWTLEYWSRINRHFGFWENKYQEMEFQPLGNESLPFCRMKWFHLHVKIAFFHLCFWLNGQGGSKFCLGPGMAVSSTCRKVLAVAEKSWQAENSASKPLSNQT